MGSLSSISRTIVTPSLVTVGAPNFFSSTTLRPLGPSVIRTDWATVSMPRFRPCRASTSNATALGMRSHPPRDYFFDFPFPVMTARTSFSEMIRYSMSSSLNSLPAYLAYRIRSPTFSSIGTLVPVQDPTGTDSLHDPLLGLLLGGVGEHDPALGALLLL